MTWPQWIETLKERYLANQASVFVLHGAVSSGRWSYAGESLDCPGILRRFLERSRDMVGLLEWETATLAVKPRLRFPGIQDGGRFARHLGARMVLDGITESLQPATPEKALGLIWLALDTPGASPSAWPTPKRAMPLRPVCKAPRWRLGQRPHGSERATTWSCCWSRTWPSSPRPWLHSVR